MELTKYNAARRALAECSRVDEVKKIHDKAFAIKAYAKQAGDTELLADAQRIMWRAKDRMGELLKDMEKNKGGAGKSGGGTSGSKKEPQVNDAPTLADLGISKKMSSEAQRIAALSTKLKEEALASENPDKAMRATLKARAKKNTEAKETLAASKVLDEGKTYKKAAAEAGINGTEQVLKTSVAFEKGRRQGATEKAAADSLSMTAQQKLEAVMRMRQRELEAKFEQRVQAEVRKRLEESVLPHYNAKLAEFQRVVGARKGVMSNTTFKLIWSCLHPDSRNSVTNKKLEEAFNAFEGMKLLLLDEKQMPTSKATLPRNFEEMVRRGA